METPSSTRRVTRSQTSVAQNSNSNNIPISRKAEDSEKVQSKSRPRNGKALIDITNDSPIVGLAMGSLETPAQAKQRSCRAKNTPGSGEALLRGQVKTLLQQVEEEAELSKITLESRTFRLIQGINGSSPMGLVAPTPANTPQVSDLTVDATGSNNGGVGLEKPSPFVQEQLFSQVVCDIFEGKNQESLESQKSTLSRSLLLDFSEKYEISSASSECSSAITEIKEKSSPEDDSASIWSIQVNASTHDEDEEEVDEEIVEEEDYYLKGCDEIEEEQDGGYDVDELCDGISKICVDAERKMPTFAGKHTRFVYDSDGEIVDEQEEVADSTAVVSPNALRFKGLPTPRGTHLRFLEEED